MAYARGWYSKEETLGTAKPRRTMRFANIGANHHFGVHNSNLLNAERAVAERVFNIKSVAGFIEPPVPRDGIFRERLSTFRSRLLGHMPTTARIDEEEFLEYYTGRKRVVYQKAVDDIKIRDVCRQDSYLSAFLKAEKINFSAKPDAVPRLIQPRSPRYNVAVGCYIKPIEHHIYRAIDKVFGAPVVVKGKNAIERGEMIREAWDSLVDPVALFLDASRFDQHFSKQCLQFEHSFYLYLFQNDPELRKYLGWQINNRGFMRLPDGTIKYSVEGIRCSGDMNTALGNVLIMCAMMYEYLKTHASGQFRLINDGDDSVVMVERKVYNAVKQSCKKWFLEMGFTMKYEGESDVFEKIEFCQSQPVFDGQRWVMCRDPRIVLDKDLVSVRPINDRETWAKQASAIADCGLALAGNLPVFCSFYSMIHQGKKVARELATGMDYLARGMTGGRSDVHPSARFSFYKAFGITPDEQEALELHYDTTRLYYEKPEGPKGYIYEPHNELLSS